MTMKTDITRAALALAATLAIAGAARADGEPTVKDLTVEQSAVAVIQTPPDYHADRPDRLAVSAWVNAQDSTYKIGEYLTVYVKVNKPAFVTVFNVGASRTVTRLYPNDLQPAELIPPNAVVAIPGEDSEFKIRVAGPTGVELIKVIATTIPYDFVSADQLAPVGPYRSVRGGSQVLARDLEVVAREAPRRPDYEIAFYDKVIRTLNRLAGAPQ